MNVLKRIRKILFVRLAIEDKADLRSFAEKPSKRVIIGLSLIVISYVIGWPAVGVVGALSFSLNKPSLFIVGGSLIYGLSIWYFF